VATAGRRHLHRSDFAWAMALVAPHTRVFGLASIIPGAGAIKVPGLKAHGHKAGPVGCSWNNDDDVDNSIRPHRYLIISGPYVPLRRRTSAGL
jgi:hypothetical protein